MGHDILAPINSKRFSYQVHDSKYLWLIYCHSPHIGGCLIFSTAAMTYKTSTAVFHEYEYIFGDEEQITPTRIRLWHQGKRSKHHRYGRHPGVDQPSWRKFSPCTASLRATLTQDNRTKPASLAPPPAHDPPPFQPHRVLTVRDTRCTSYKLIFILIVTNRQGTTHNKQTVWRFESSGRERARRGNTTTDFKSETRYHRPVPGINLWLADWRRSFGTLLITHHSSTLLIH